MKEEVSSNVDAGHAFYLGYEMAKASIALLLGKQYEQDEALRWGFLTKEEDHHRLATHQPPSRPQVTGCELVQRQLVRELKPELPQWKFKFRFES